MAAPLVVQKLKELATSKASLDSPAFTGAPTAPTAAAGTSSTQIATTEFVASSIYSVNGNTVSQLTTLTSALAANTAFTVPEYTVGANVVRVWIDGIQCYIGADSTIHQFYEVGTTGTTSTTIKFYDAYAIGRKILVQVSYPASTLLTAAANINGYAPLNSPTFVGTPVAPTADDANYTLGGTGGEATHTLTTGEIPPHLHSQNGHTWGWGYLGTNLHMSCGGSQVQAEFNAGTGNPINSMQGIEGWNTTNYAGGGAAHNNMPPYLIVYVWKRTA